MTNLDLKKIPLDEAISLAKAYRKSRNVDKSKAFFIPLNVLEKFLVVPEVKGIHVYIGEQSDSYNGKEHCLLLVPTTFTKINDKDAEFEKEALFGSEEKPAKQDDNVATEDILFYSYSLNGGNQSQQVETVYSAGPHPPPPNTKNKLNTNP